MILDTTLIQTFRIINGTFVADVDDSFNLAFPIAYEDVWRVGIVNLAKGFHCAKDTSDGFRDWAHSLPFGQVLDVPLALCGKVLELPAKGESSVDVFVKEGVDKAG